MHSVSAADHLHELVSQFPLWSSVYLLVKIKLGETVLRFPSRFGVMLFYKTMHFLGVSFRLIRVYSQQMLCSLKAELGHYCSASNSVIQKIASVQNC